MAAAAAPMLVNGDACHDAWNGGGIDFGASQCIQWNQFDTAAAADARSVHTLRYQWHSTRKWDNEYTENLHIGSIPNSNSTEKLYLYLNWTESKFRSELNDRIKIILIAEASG